MCVNGDPARQAHDVDQIRPTRSRTLANYKELALNRRLSGAADRRCSHARTGLAPHPGAQPAGGAITINSSPSISELATLAGRIRACRICIETPRGAPLPHEPRPVLRLSSTARLLIASQAPGVKKSMSSGLPFNDASGDRLHQWMKVCARRILRRGADRDRADGFLFSWP